MGFFLLAGLPPIDKPWVDGTHFVLGRDFLNTWMGGRSAFFGGPAPWFDLHVYNQALIAVCSLPVMMMLSALVYFPPHRSSWSRLPRAWSGT